MILRKKNILIVDDSALMRRLFSDIIVSDGRFDIIDTAVNGLEAFDLVTLSPKKYDVIILDINMPKMSGIQFLEQLEKIRLKQKVIIVSTVAKEGAKETIRCLELGAFDFITKPENYITAKDESFKSKLLTVIAVATGLDMAGLSDRTLRYQRPESASERPSFKNTGTKPTKREHTKVPKTAKKIVALACSTGGPKALQQVIPLLPENLDAPMVLVQHMPVGFTNSLAQRLNESSKISVKEAEEGDILKKGVVYIARGGSHLRVVKKAGTYKIALTDEAARGGLRPCADIMYESLLDCDYDDVISVVLTGMGADGTKGITQLNGVKNMYVISQDEASCTVYGMPKMIYETGLVDEVVSLENVADAIVKITGVQ